MSVEQAIRNAVGNDMQKKREIRMYGCTEAQMRDRKSTRLNSSH